MSPRDNAVSVRDKRGAIAPCRAIVVRSCSPEWRALCFEAVVAGTVPVNREWQRDVGRRMRAHRLGLGIR